MQDDVKRIFRFILATLVIVCVAVAGCSGDDETQFDCDTHDHCLAGEACLGEVCVDAPSEGDDCPSEYEGEEFGELICEDGVWTGFQPPAPPSVDSVTAVPPTGDPEEAIELRVEVSSEVEEELQYQWSAPEGWELIDDDEPVVELIAHPDFGETATIEVVVTDPFDQSDSGSVTTSTHEVDGPEIVSISAEPESAIPNEVQTVEAEIHHPQQLDVDYHWTIPEQWSAQGTLDGPHIELVAPDKHEVSATVELVVNDEADKEATASIGISTESNPGPTIEELTTDEIAPEPDASTAVFAVATHEFDYELVDYQWAIDNGDWGIEQDEEDPAVAIVDTSDIRQDEAVVTVEVIDEYGGLTEESLMLRTAPEQNEAPVIEDLFADDDLVDPDASTTVYVEAEDPMGFELSYHWSVESDEDWEVEAVEAAPTSAEVNAPDAYGSTVEITIEVVDEFGLSTQDTISVHTKTEENEAPIIEDLYVEETPVDPDASTTVYVEAIDPYGLELEYSWEVDNDDWKIEADQENQFAAVLDAPHEPSSNVEVTVIVEDEEGLTSEDVVSAETVENADPEIDFVEAQQDEIVPSESTTVEVQAFHPQDFELSYDWSVSDDSWTITETDDEYIVGLEAPHEPSSSVVVEVSVTDAYGGEKTSQTSVQTFDNPGPDITGFDGDEQDFEPGETRDVYVVTSHNYDFEISSYDWSLETDDDWQIIGPSTGEFLTVQSPQSPNSEATLSIEIADEFGGTGIATATIETITNDAPHIEELSIEPQSPLAPDTNFEVSVDAYDPDGGKLEYEWSISEEWEVDEENTPSSQGISPDISNHEATVEVLVRDEWGYESSKSLQIRTLDHEPDSFFFQLHPSGLEPNVVVESDEIFVVQNFEGPITAVCQECEVSHNGGDYAPEVEGVEPGDELQVRAESPGFGEMREAYLQVGHTESNAWRLTTIDWEGARVFTNCDAEGAEGPSEDACEDEYTDQPHEDELITVDGGIQRWEVPADGIYEIQALGAKGGGSGGGLGARIQGDVELEKGQQIQILVGQQGDLFDPGIDCMMQLNLSAGTGFSGGGGSFVVDADDQPLVIAGGGGGNGGDGQISSNGADGSGSEVEGQGGENGSHGEDVEGERVCDSDEPPRNCVDPTGNGGGGFFDGGETNEGFLEGGVGTTRHPEGGFGGGGGARECVTNQAGGGGGYSGGGGAVGSAVGGGGGSYNVGDNPVEESGYNDGHGQVTIDWVGSE